ncbi:MAG: hypothetical protein O7E53_07655 [Alphaproteobacteria bacterium]|nr:hypothetical protein [Alphaproteobacteria bacterium]
MGKMASKFVFTQDKDRFPDLIAGDDRLSSSELRILISLFNHLHTGTRESAGLSDLAGATSLPEAQVTAALGTLIARGYVAEQVGPAPGPGPDPAPDAAPGPAEETGHAGGTREKRAAGDAPGKRRAGDAPGKRPAGAGAKRPVLDARIMDYELDLDHLIAAGDANIRNGQGANKAARQSQSGGADDESPIADWNPLVGDETRSSAMRFTVWLRFVLNPDELDACDRFTLSHKDEWCGWIDRFATARAAGRDDGLLDDIRKRLDKFNADGPPASRQPIGADKPHRHH